MKPLASIVIPVYNRAGPLLERALKSAENQTDRDFEVIVVDDGSTDNLKTVLPPVVGENKVKYVRQEHVGVSAARNLGVRHTNGDIIVFLDSDDELSPDYLSSVKKYFSECDAEVLVPGFILKDEAGKISYSPLSKPEWMMGMGGGVAFRKSVFAARGIWHDEQLRNFEDSDFGFRVVTQCKVALLEKFIYTYHFKSAVYKDSEKNLSSNPNYLLKDFEIFKDKNEMFYKRFGSRALSDLYFWEGTIYANSDIKKARRSFLKSFSKSPRLKNLIYCGMSLLGSVAVYKFLNQLFIFVVRRYKILKHYL